MSAEQFLSKPDIKISIKPITYRETQSSEIFLNSFKVKILPISPALFNCYHFY